MSLWVTEKDLSVFVLPETKWDDLTRGQSLQVEVTGRNNWADLERDLPEGMRHSKFNLTLLDNLQNTSMYWKVQVTSGDNSRIGFLSQHGLSPLYLLSFLEF